MGRSYTVPRSAKGETRILYIFTLKSLDTTIVTGIIGFLIYLLVKTLTNGGSLVMMILFIAPFAAIGYVVGAAKIPDSPIMGPLQKAGGENVSDILFRLATFRGKKKIYMYNIDRKSKVNTTNNNANKGKGLFKV